MTREEAVRSFTTWNAYASRQEDQVGALTPGTPRRSHRMLGRRLHVSGSRYQGHRPPRDDGRRRGRVPARALIGRGHHGGSLTWPQNSQRSSSGCGPRSIGAGTSWRGSAPMASSFPRRTRPATRTTSPTTTRTLLGHAGLPVERFEPRHGRVSLVSTQPGREERPRFVFNGHLDHFPSDDAALWSFPPYGGEIRDGKILGRGVSDMRGGLTRPCSRSC